MPLQSLSLAARRIATFPPARPASLVPATSFALAILCALVTPARADVPSVATDIPPVHSLVSQVIGELGRPSLAMRAGASPHGYAMRPSDAAVLERADLVFWTSSVLTPWLAREIGKIAPDARSIELMAVEGTRTLPTRRGATFDTSAHRHGEREGDRGGGDPRSEVSPAEGTGEDEHSHDERHDDEHADGHAGPEGATHAIDPHGWLDPGNARHWLGVIAEALSDADPDNAAVYASNAAAARAGIDALIERTAARMAAMEERRFVVFHDSFQYFEDRFDTPASASLSPDDASEASPARVQAVRELIAGLGMDCVFTEPQLDSRRVRVLVDGLDIERGVLDPLGAELEPGPDLYGRLIDDLADAFLACGA